MATDCNFDPDSPRCCQCPNYFDCFDCEFGYQIPIPPPLDGPLRIQPPWLRTRYRRDRFAN